MKQQSSFPLLVHASRFTGYSSDGEKGERPGNSRDFRAISDQKRRMLDDNFHLLVEKNSFTEVRKLVGPARHLEDLRNVARFRASRTMAKGKATFFPSRPSLSLSLSLSSFCLSRLRENAD